MGDAIYFGNASTDSRDYRGWFVGQFIASDDLRCNQDVEVKWGVHPAGDEREWGVNRAATSLGLLIVGRFRYTFPDREVVLREQGDYVIWAAGTPHRWLAEIDSSILTVRWPSVVDDGITVSDEQALSIEQSS